MDALLKRRRVCKGLLTRIETFSATLNVKSCEDEVRERVRRAKELLNQFAEVEDQIFNEKADEKSEGEEFEEQYYRVVAKLNKWLRLQPSSSAVPFNDSILNSSQASNNDFRLPRVNIPCFSGDYQEWQSFFDLFNKIVHENQSLSAAQKFQYLKGLLKGEASNLLKHLAVTEANYIEAFQKLCKRYDRKSLTANSFIKLFMEQPTIRHANSSSIRKLLDRSDEATRGLKALGAQAESKDPWLLYILFHKLDDESKQLWMRHTSEEDFPALQTFYDFLANRADELEGINASQRSQSSRSVATVKGFHLSSDSTCPICQTNDHQLFECSKFKSMDIIARRELIKTDGRCFNCLNNNHGVYDCRSKKRCRICHKKHHSLLHLLVSSKETVPTYQTSATSTFHQRNSEESSQQLQPQPITPNRNNNQPQGDGTTSYNVNINENVINQTLLPTAIIKVKDGFGEWKLCRALLDSGSQASFVSEDLVQRLQLKRTNARIHIRGIGHSTAGLTRGKVTISISSCMEDNNWQLECLVISNVTSCQPATFIDKPNLFEIQHLQLADPNFNQPSKIDVLLGIDQFFSLLRPGVVKLNTGRLFAQNTAFGWVIAGSSYSNIQDSQYVSNLTSHHCEINVDQLLQRFWELEEITSRNKPINYSAEEKCCEEHFEKTTDRMENGKFVVKLPFKPTISRKLGNTTRGALKRLESMERRFAKDAKFKKYYQDFMNEYLALNHMEEVPTDEINRNDGVYYLPHHGVLKESSSTTKLRVVYDASFKSNNGTSLNDILMVGPTVYEPLISILIRFRLHKIVFTADIEKMFRQIVLHPDDRDYHRILWRSDNTNPPTHYRLTTVTYGTSSAPYLATKSLQMIGNSLMKDQPMVAQKILQDFYVDDFMSGCHTPEDAFKIQQTVTDALKSYGFNLRKWSSNYNPLLEKIAPESRDTNPRDIEDQSYSTLLGIQWNAVRDEFQIKVSLKENSTGSKREVLSQSARIFDPMGWLAPAIVNIKILFQSLWLLNLDWDDELPPNEANIWQNIRSELPELEKIKIPRWYGLSKETFELHGFSDASEKAYAAVVYFRCVDEHGNVKISIISSKTKVAPINQVCIPRLELCAAALLATLIVSVREALLVPDVKTTLWTDSTIVLGWLSSPPRRWKTFVANRTSNILSKTSRSCWNHVDSQQNPADCASRGMMPSQLNGFNLWWHGPDWLSRPQKEWPNQRLPVDERELTIEERKSNPTILTATANTDHEILSQLLIRISSYQKIIRVLAWIYRCYDKAKQLITNHSIISELTVDELKRSQSKIYKWVQNEYFATEISSLTSNRNLLKSSKLRSLNPFVDEQDLLRVGGRIENSAVEYDTKHPLILPSCDLTKLLIRDLHKKHQHAGASLLTSIIRQRYHILKCRKLVKDTIKQCNICRRYNAKPSYQIMGNLPGDRVCYESPFLKTGVDYAGPLELKQIYGRSTHRWKGYLAIFVCMATKAVHIEVVSNLTTSHFIAALQRFIARRGLCTDIYSDNGSNFIGANNALHDMYQFIKSNSNNIFSFLTSENIKWHFIPGAAPTFGGLWEAAVKSFKYHLRRVMGNTVFTFEELTTVANQIEAVLNSRPLCILSDDQIDPLTPGHFLIGRPIVQVPYPVLTEVKASHLSRWQHMQLTVQHFCNRWKFEYLTSLQRRSKWQTKGQPIQLNDVVFIREDNLPPTKWLLGKVEKVHPGTDGIVRVATVKTKAGHLKRPIHKLCRFPIDELNQQIQCGRNVSDQQSPGPATSSGSKDHKNLGSLTLCILLLHEKGMTNKLENALAESLKMVPSAGAIIDLLKKTTKPSALGGLLKNLGDYLLVVGDRSQGKIHFPLLFFEYAWTKTPDALRERFNFSGVGGLVWFCAYGSRCKFLRFSAGGFEQIRQVEFHAMFESCTEDLGVLEKITNEPMWRSRAGVSEVFNKNGKVDVEFQPLFFTKISRMASANMTKLTATLQPMLINKIVASPGLCWSETLIPNINKNT